MGTDSNKKIIEDLFSEVVNGQNLSATDKFIGPGYVNHGIPNAKTGPSGFKEIIQQFISAFPDLHVTQQQFIADGDTVAVRGYWTGTNKGSFIGAPASGRKVRVDYVDIWRIQNGKGVENWVQMDMLGVMQQIGVMPVSEHA